MSVTSPKRFGAVYAGMPEVVAVRCPRCRGLARFTSPYGFVDSPDPAIPADRLVKYSRGFAVILYPGEFPWRDPNNPYIHIRRGQVWGVLTCSRCAARLKHRLAWPSDAFFKFSVAGHTIWAWCREDLLRLNEVIQGDRHVLLPIRRGYLYLRHIPRTAWQLRNRSRAVRSIRALLTSG